MNQILINIYAISGTENRQHLACHPHNDITYFKMWKQTSD